MIEDVCHGDWIKAAFAVVCKDTDSGVSAAG